MAQSHKTIFGMSEEVWGGIILLAAAIAALMVVNMGAATWYENLLHIPLTLGVQPLALTKTFHHWVNDGLMVLFFLVIGIEIHREIRLGSLRNPQQALVPIAAAIGGFAVPALIYLAIAGGDATALNGWSIPTATDIAFAVALITVLKDYVPPALRVFLLALAVADDLMAILVIALFYTADVIWMNLFLAAMGVAILLAKNKLGIRKLWVYVLVGIFMWLCVLKSGVHATVAGVMIGFLLPLHGKNGAPSPAETVEHALMPWVRWLILPLFAFVNVGVNLTELAPADVLSPIPLGIAAALLIGKQLGVFGTVFALEKCGLGRRPEGATWRQMYGVSALCGIGFTMSLFIGALAFDDTLQPLVRLGVLMGSTLSAILATVILLKR